MVLLSTALANTTVFSDLQPSHQADPPPTPTVGKTWVDSDNGDVKFWNGAEWVLVNDNTSGGGGSSPDMIYNLTLSSTATPSSDGEFNADGADISSSTIIRLDGTDLDSVDNTDTFDIINTYNHAFTFKIVGQTSGAVASVTIDTGNMNVSGSVDATIELPILNVSQNGTFQDEVVHINLLVG